MALKDMISKLPSQALDIRDVLKDIGTFYRALLVEGSVFPSDTENFYTQGPQYLGHQKEGPLLGGHTIGP